MNRRDDFWFDVLEWCLGIVALALVGCVVLQSIECAAAAIDAAGKETR